MASEVRSAGEDRRMDPDTADVRLAQSGDDRAFERVYLRHAPRVRATARWLLGNADLDAVVQDVFVRVWEQLHHFGGTSSFRTWLNRVAVNVVLRARERAGRDRDRFDDEAAASDRAVRDVGADVRTEMEDAVDRLPKRAREVFVLHDMHGYTPAEIAQMLGLALNTVRSQIARSRLALRRQLSDAAVTSRKVSS